MEDAEIFLDVYLSSMLQGCEPHICNGYRKRTPPDLNQSC
jgi:hypothetical protein